MSDFQDKLMKERYKITLGWAQLGSRESYDTDLFGHDTRMVKVIDGWMLPTFLEGMYNTKDPKEAKVFLLEIERIE